MNVLLVVPRLNIGGAETYVVTTAIALQQQGYNVFVASGGGMLADFLNARGIRHYFVPIRLNAALAAYLLERIIKKHNIHIVHANSAAAGIAAVRVKKRLHVPVIYTAHGVFGHNAQEMTLDQCDKIICVSEYVRNYAIQRGFSPKRLITVYSGIDLDKFKPDSRKKSIIRQSVGIPEDAFTLAIVARIKNLRNKGHADILQILEKYSGAQNWHLMVIGKGKGLWKLKYHIWRNKLNNRVHCLGHIVNVQDILDGADVMVLPSNFETFGLVLTEAMAMEKPVVAYAVGGTPEVIEHECTGFLVEKGNTDELFNRLCALDASEGMRREMGCQGRKRVENFFDTKQMAQKLVRIYQEIGR